MLDQKGKKSENYVNYIIFTTITYTYMQDRLTNTGHICVYTFQLIEMICGLDVR